MSTAPSACSKRRAPTGRRWRPTRKAAFRFLHVSTDEVYGTLGPDDAPFTETTAYAPNSPYSASKAASDHLVRAYHHTYGLPTLTTNCSNNYGPYHFPEKLIPLMIANALAGKPLPIYGDGMQVRDWLYVSDHCAAIRACSKRAAGRGLQRRRLERDGQPGRGAHAVRYARPAAPKADSYRAQITYVTDRPGHDRRYAIDARKLERELGWKPAETFETGIMKPCSGTWTTRPGSPMCSRAPTAWVEPITLIGRPGMSTPTIAQGHHPGRRFRHPPVSDDDERVEAAAADLRQADDLLSADHADAGRHPRDPDHLDAAGHAALSRAAGRRQPVGHQLEYAVQPSPDGLAQAFIIGREFVGDHPSALILGDNIYYGHGLDRKLNMPMRAPTARPCSPTTCRIRSATAWSNSAPTSRRAVDRGKAAQAEIELRRHRPVFLRRPGVRYRRRIKPSARGELEITDVNRAYLEKRRN
jgi:hypothetical protein